MKKRNKKKGAKKKGAKPNRPLFDPIASLCPLPAEKVKADMDRNYSALDAMATTVGTSDTQWIELSDVVNTVEMLIEMGEVDGEHTAVTQAAIAAMTSASRRHIDNGEPMRMGAEEVQVMRDVLTLYHTCLERKTWMVIYKAQKACTERINRELAESRAKKAEMV